MGVGYTPGTGAVVAADTVGGELRQIVRLDVGTGTAATPLSSSAPLPIAFTGSDGISRSMTATTTSQQLMAANPNRRRFYIANDSTVDVWASIGSAAQASAGNDNKRIAANGGYWELPGCTAAVFIIASSSTAAVTAREF